MKKFNRKFKIGTNVKIMGIPGFQKIKEIHETRNWIKIEGYEGYFQIGHIETYNVSKRFN